MALDRWLSPRRMTLVAIVMGLLVLAGGQFIFPEGRVARTNASLHVGLDVVEGMIALLIAYLMVGRVRDRQRLSDLLCLYALLVLGLSKVVLLGIPTVAAGTRGDLQVWAAPVGRVVGSGALALAALMRGRRVDSPAKALRLTWGAGVATVLVVSVASRTFRSAAPHDPMEPSVLWFHAVTALALAIASVGFVERASRSGEEMFGWFGAGCALGAIARLGYVIYPAQDFDDVYIQDFLRLAFYVLLLVGAQREITSYWQSRTHLAALEERRRVARDLHDGLAQELVFISGQIKRLQRTGGGTGLDQLSSAADRAVSEARRAIAALTYPGVQSLSEALEELADEFTARYRISVDLTLDPTIDLRPTTREVILRIAREAMNNAVRHGQAKVIGVTTLNEDGVSIEITDDGVGFDPGAGRAREGGFGLISMRERAEAAGGDFDVRSEPGGGTSVKVRLPSQPE